MKRNEEFLHNFIQKFTYNPPHIDPYFLYESKEKFTLHMNKQRKT